MYLASVLWILFAAFKWIREIQIVTISKFMAAFVFIVPFSVPLPTER